jgi:hypothetical protein
VNWTLTDLPQEGFLNEYGNADPQDVGLLDRSVVLRCLDV